MTALELLAAGRDRCAEHFAKLRPKRLAYSAHPSCFMSESPDAFAEAAALLEETRQEVWRTRHDWNEVAAYDLAIKRLKGRK